MSESRFDFRRIASDREGYYYDRWDLAVPMSVVANTENEARTKAAEISGQCRSGRFWKFRLDRVTAVKGCGCDA